MDGLAAAAALLAAVGSVVGLSSAANIYGQETANFADQAAAQDLVTLLPSPPLFLFPGGGRPTTTAGGPPPAGPLAFTRQQQPDHPSSIHFGPLSLS